MFKELMLSVQQAVDIKEGNAQAARRTFVSSKDIREKLDMTQQHFADLLGVSRRTVEKWEQGIAQPSGAARTLLHVANHYPHVILDVRSHISPKGLSTTN